MCAHIGQNRDVYPPGIYGVHLDSIPPPPFAQVDGGGCYREKFFLIFIFLIFARNLRISGLRIIFFIFQISSLYSSDFDFLIIGS